PGAELAAELGAGDLDQPALERAMHVFVAREWQKGAPIDGLLQRVEGLDHARELRLIEVTGRREGPGVRPRPRDVVIGQLPVEMSRLAECRELGRRASGKARAPERA